MVARQFEPGLLLLYRVHLLGKRVKARSGFAYYAFKCVLIEGLAYSIFLA
jgi:hypothetical protein